MKIVAIIREIIIVILTILVLIVTVIKKIVVVKIILTQGNKILGPGGAMEGTDYAMLRPRRSEAKRPRVEGTCEPLSKFLYIGVI